MHNKFRSTTKQKLAATQEERLMYKQHSIQYIGIVWKNNCERCDAVPTSRTAQNPNGKRLQTATASKQIILLSWHGSCGARHVFDGAEMSLFIIV